MHTKQSEHRHDGKYIVLVTSYVKIIIVRKNRKDALWKSVKNFYTTTAYIIKYEKYTSVPRTHTGMSM